MRQIALFIIALASFGMTSRMTWALAFGEKSALLPPDQPATLQECLDQALRRSTPLATSFQEDWQYMGMCAMRFPKVERDAFEAYIQPYDPSTPVRVGNIVLTGLGAADFLEAEAKQSAKMPEALKPVLGYWRVDKMDFRKREYGGNFGAETSAEAFTLFPRVNTVVDRIEAFGFSRKNRGECIVVAPHDLDSPAAWAEAFYATARHYGIRGKIVVDDATLQTLTQGLRRPRVLATKQGPEHTTPLSKESYRNTWHLVLIP